MSLDNTQNSFYDLFLSQDYHVLNLEKLQLLTKGDKDLSLALLGLFKQQAPDYLSRLHVACKSEQLHSEDGLFQAVHAIKGAALCIAAETAADLARKIEEQILVFKTIDFTQCSLLEQELQSLINYIYLIEMRTLSKE